MYPIPQELGGNSCWTSVCRQTTRWRRFTIQDNCFRSVADC